jgi:hypothetical protein
VLERIRAWSANRGVAAGRARTATGPGSAARDDSTAPRGRVRGAASGVASGVATGTRRLLAAIAAAITLITGLIALLIVIGIAFIVLKANRDNSIVSWVHDAAKFFVGPFDGMFKPKSHRAEVAVNWGIAAVLYAFVGRLIARLVSPADRS